MKTALKMYDNNNSHIKMNFGKWINHTDSYSYIKKQANKFQKQATYWRKKDVVGSIDNTNRYINFYGCSIIKSQKQKEIYYTCLY